MTCCASGLLSPIGNPWRAVPPAALPARTAQVVIDGSTQPGFAGKPLIVLNGAGAGSGADGLVLQAYGCTIRGLVINNFASGRGIKIDMVDGNTIAGNYIGTNA